jgi:hypothetical protein
MIQGRNGFVRVAQTLEVWDVEDEWWRSPISRSYAALLLENGRVVTVFKDEIAQRWFLQGG